MDHPALDAEGGLVHRFVHRRVGVHRRDEILHRRLQPLGDGDLPDQLGCVLADDVATENLAVRLGGDELDQPVGGADGGAITPRRAARSHSSDCPMMRRASS